MKQTTNIYILADNSFRMQGYCSSLTNITFSDTSIWYRIQNSNQGQGMTNGYPTSVTNSSQNATYFTSTYYDYYWYKL